MAQHIGAAVRSVEAPVLGVVVPVDDEEALLGAGLDGLATAARAVSDRARVRVVVVLDACSDRGAQIAARYPVETLRVEARTVGRARRAGCAALLEGDSPAWWLATTDADSVVPREWLAAHLDALEDGCDALVGTIAVADWGEHPLCTRVRFDEDYQGDQLALNRRDRLHRHVHGANLGVHAGSYRAVGGFAPRPSGEDVDLVARLSRAGGRMRRTRDIPVRTSAHRRTRTPRFRRPPPRDHTPGSPGRGLVAGGAHPASPVRSA